jgi:phosphoglucosamine mutase
MLRFGTDGVRGLANAELTPELVLALGRAAARVLGAGSWVVGRDTRLSGPLLSAALTAGLAAEGASVVDLGVVPTPGVAHTAAARSLPGAVVSASHNPFPDNGIKFFAAGGRKLDDATEEALESQLAAILEGAAADATEHVAADVGRIDTDPLATEAYVGHLIHALEGRTLAAVNLVLDCANGAASAYAGDVFRRAGATVTVLHAQPDGTNINHGCGSTHPEALQQAVRDKPDATMGLAFDGDADRVLAVDENGDLVDGDMILALLAADMRERKTLANDTLVVTVMSNLGLRLAMSQRGIRVVETNVGDRYVLEALEEGGHSLGGEQSGHVILPDRATTGDGMLTGLLVADLVARRQTSFAQLAREAMTRLPQVLKNVRVRDRDAIGADEGVRAMVASVERRLGDHGRVLLRPSGTEPVVRVMVEAPTQDEAHTAAEEIASAVAAAAAP